MDSLIDVQQFPVGSSLYYRIRFAPKTARAKLQALIKIWQAIVDCLNSRDPGIARTRLYWWLDECEKLTKQQTLTHPQLQLLSQANIDFTAFSVAIHAVIGRLDQPQFIDETALYDYCEQTRAVISKMCARILGAEITDTCVTHTGRALGLFTLLYRASDDWQHGRLNIPLNWLDEFGHHAEQLGQEPLSLALCQRFSDAITQSRTQALNTLPKSFKFLRSQLLLDQHHLKYLQRKQFPIFQQRLTLSPLRKLLICLIG